MWQHSSQVIVGTSVEWAWAEAERRQAAIEQEGFEARLTPHYSEATTTLFWINVEYRTQEQ